MRLLLTLLLLTAAAPVSPADDKAEVEAIETLRKKLPDDRKGELGDRLARLKEPEKWLGTLIGHCGDGAVEGEEYDTVAIDVYVAAFRRLRPDHPEGLVWAARRAAQRQKNDEAVALYKATLEKVPAADRGRYFDETVRGMAWMGRDLEAYAAVPAPDRRAAFRLLGEKLYGGLHGHLGVEVSLESARARLDKLIATHGAADPADPHVPLLQAKLKDKANDLAAADALYAKAHAALVGVKGGKALEDRATAFYARVEIGYRMGKGVEAYKMFASADDPDTAWYVFHSLEERYDRDRDAAGYRALLAEHEKRQPKAPDLAYYRGVAHWLAKDYGRAADEFHRHLEKVWAVPGQKKPRLNHDYGTRGANERLIRSLLRAGRAAEVPGAVAKMGKRADYTYPVFAAAAAGDVAGTARAVDAIATGQPGMPTLAQFYSDPDLGPILRSPAFASFRAARPEPPETFRQSRD